MISWLIWWIGDVFGVWIAAPIMFIAFAQPRQLWQPRGNSIALPVLIMLTAVLFLFIWMSKWEVDRENSEFNEIAHDFVHELDVSFKHYLDVVTLVERFYVSSSDEFHTFVTKTLESKKAIQGLSWNPVIKNTQRDSVEKKIRKEGFPDFHITERTAQGKLVRAADRDEYVVVSFIEPMHRNSSAMGFDVASNSERLKALNKARDSGRAVATAAITLVQDENKQAGFLLFHPVYKGPSSNVEERRQSLKGYAVGVFRIADIVDAVLKSHVKDRVVVSISDGRGAGSTQLYAPKASTLFTNAIFKWNDSFDIGGRKWFISIVPSKNYLSTFSEWRAWTIFAEGCFFISMLSAFLLAMTGRSYQVQRFLTMVSALVKEKNSLSIFR